MKAALWLLDGTSLPGLRELILALDGKVARCSGNRAAGTRALHMVSDFLVREGLLAQEPYAGRGPRHDRRRRLPDGHRAGPAGGRHRLRAGRQAQPAHPPQGSEGGLRRCRTGRFRTGGAGPLRDRRAQRRPHRVAHRHGPGRPRPLRVGGGARGVARPAQPDPGTHGTHRTPRAPATLRALLHREPASGRGRPCWNSSAATGVSRTACTAPWTCSSGRTTAACARGTAPP